MRIIKESLIIINKKFFPVFVFTVFVLNLIQKQSLTALYKFAIFEQSIVETALVMMVMSIILEIMIIVIYLYDNNHFYLVTMSIRLCK